ncbi:MAG: hypothetical protein NZ903_03140 [Candidatus Micrarchaeota archaeon]|nr:hypothetical protein [Candidatus Micrarchaeota archaeon]
MGIIKAPIFSLDITLKSGQVFGWKKIKGWWVGEIKGKIVKIKQKNGYLEFKGGKREEIKRYFSLDIPEERMKKIYMELSKDVILADAIKEFYGLRIIKQEPWYCTATFVCSSFSNIPRIERTIENIKKAHGKRLNGHLLFPSINEMKRIGKKELRKCGLGFRDEYLHDIASRVNEEWFDEVKNLEYREAKKKLMELKGVGEKIADCILLFGYGMGEAFPVDVWIKRAMLKFYGDEIKRFAKGKRISDEVIREFAREKWNGNAGLAQQFLYVYSRKKRIKI